MTLEDAVAEWYPDGSAGQERAPLDDFDARPGSATSLLRTIVGAYLRGIGGEITVAELVRLMGAVGVSPSHARTAVARVKHKGLLLAADVTGQPGYRLNPGAVPMLERGDRRIFGYRQQRESDLWCLVSFSLPESQRDARHQLRKRLSWIGCGTVANGLWICPSHLANEVEQILHALGLAHAATIFIAAAPRTSGTLAELAAAWWDLPRIAALHRDFLAATEGLSRSPDERAAFAHYVTALDQWRVIPYLDPGLPASMLPDDWPGSASLARFETLRRELEGRARAFVG